MDAEPRLRQFRCQRAFQGQKEKRLRVLRGRTPEVPTFARALTLRRAAEPGSLHNRPWSTYRPAWPSMTRREGPRPFKPGKKRKSLIARCSRADGSICSRVGGGSSDVESSVIKIDSFLDYQDFGLCRWFSRACVYSFKRRGLAIFGSKRKLLRLGNLNRSLGQLEELTFFAEYSIH